MRKAILLAIVAMLMFVVESYAFDPVVFNIKRSVKKAANGGGTLQAYSFTTRYGQTYRANPVTVTIMDSASGTPAVTPLRDGTYSFIAKDATNNRRYTFGWYTKETIGRLGTFSAARDYNGYSYAKFQLSRAAKTRMANGESIIAELNERLLPHGYQAQEVTKTRRDPTTGEYRTYKTIKLQELPM